MLAEEIAILIQDVWLSSLKQPLEQLPPPAEPPSIDGEAFTASVHIRGPWQGLLMITTPEALARSIASIMFGIEPDATTMEDLRDAVGEIANVVGGNVKAMLEPPSTLSLPSVYEGDLMTMGLLPPDHEMVDALVFESRGQQFLVRLVHENSEPRASLSIPAAP